MSFPKDKDTMKGMGNICDEVSDCMLVLAYPLSTVIMVVGLLIFLTLFVRKTKIRINARYLKSTSDIQIPEALLILNRASVQGLRPSFFDNHICSNHRADFGLPWKRKKRTCSHPLHDSTKAGTIAKGINLIQSREIWLKLNLHVPVGSGLCRRCIEKHKNEVQIGTDLTEELKELCFLLKRDQDRIDDQNANTCIRIGEETEKVNEENMEITTSIDDCDLEINEPKDTEELLHEYFSQITDSDLDNRSSQTTIESNWSKDERSQRDIFNQAMDMMSNGYYSPLKSQASMNINDMQYSSKMYYIRQARTALEFVCENIAPSQGSKLMALLLQNSNQKTELMKKDVLTETVITAYNKAEDQTTKVQILSIIVDKYTKSELLSMMKGLTIYKIDAARKFASTHGPGQYIAPPKISRVRLSKEKIQHFIEFISAPCYLQVVGFGSKHLKLSSGLAIKVPKVIRTMLASRLITAYNNYCTENSISPPCRATLYKIIKACAASQLKSLHGLDNYINDGMEGIDTLKKVVTNLGVKGLIQDKVTELHEKLDALKLHLKNDLKSHLTSESDCVQHCIHLALSEQECEHSHNSSCESCDSMYQINTDIDNLLKSNNFSDENEKEEVEYDFESSKDKILAWRDHSIRTVNQDICKKDILQNLKSHEVMIIADWAMKFLPHTFRETQSEWFGKQGISWHMICAVYRHPVSDDTEIHNTSFDIMSMVHIVEDGKQGWHIVSQILSNALRLLKSVHPHLKDVYIRSDNAGCYHALPLLAYLWKFRREMPLNIKEYNFSEAQSGKDLCDSRTGSCRLHMLNYINEGHDITNGKQMKEALESHGGIRNTYISLVKILNETQPALCGQIKKFSISQYNNFKFQDNGMIAFKAYGIDGELISATDMARISEKLILTDEAMMFSESKHPEIKPASSRGKHSGTFPCFEANCIKAFQKEDLLIEHLSTGEHVYDDEKSDSTEDKSKRLWSTQVQQVRFNQPTLSSSIVEQSGIFNESTGYALRKRKKAVRFSVKVKSYLTALFTAGEYTGKKPSPYTVAKQMRHEVDEAGNRLFSPSEWLSHQQIRSFFGNLCLKKQREMEKNKKQSANHLKNEMLPEDDEDLQNVIRDLEANEHNTVVSNIVSELTV